MNSAAKNISQARANTYECALQNIYNVLGPNVPKSLECCQGCQWEWGEALRLVRDALGTKLERYKGDTTPPTTKRKAKSTTKRPTRKQP